MKYYGHSISDVTHNCLIRKAISLAHFTAEELASGLCFLHYVLKRTEVL